MLAALVVLPCAGLAEVATAAPAAAAVQVLQPVVPVDTQQQQIFDGLNAQRAAVGAPALTLDPTLETVAQDWADVLGQGDGMKHNPNLQTLLSDFPQWGEIVATADMGNADTHGLENGNLAVDTWMKSDPHRAVLQDPKYTNVGIGLVYTTLWSGGRTVWRSYWVADVGSPRRTPLAGQNADGSRSFGGIPVKGAILQAYTAAGANGGVLGLPTARELGPLRGGGYGQHFAGGSVYWSAATGAAAVRGAIRDRWAALGWENSWLGYPTGAEFAVRGGVAQRFQGGLVYWSPATGAQALGGSVLSGYGASGWENGALGFPTTTAASLPAGSYAHFQNGSVYSSPAAGTHVVPSAVRDAWAARGWEAGVLGYPVSDARTTGGALVQDFQGGQVTVRGGSAQVRTLSVERTLRTR
ncbi:CAP domain-containing protein [Kineococcus sp. NPDC059986]|uniref:CAP domain-containing protein n=1 Tax=Kineococcus sp. NPDC059986 TaxID=3155538 RepID=UPI0034501CBB